MTHEIDWKPEYDTGNIMVDREHRELISLINLLLRATKNEDSELAIKDAFDVFVRYMDDHFKNEEELLNAVDSPHLISQCVWHDVLRKELYGLWSAGAKKQNERTMKGLALWGENRLLKHFISNDHHALHSLPFNDGECCAR
ncbi:MAG: hemerythrin domain-containing protein [Rhodospirillaceae bacterium]|nr:hemerythrin domain-containing protein [Rhodospirillaceae bacterium]